MKSPPVQFTDEEARQLVEEFIGGDDTGTAAGSRLTHDDEAPDA